MHNHFEGKSPLEHLFEARRKGASAESERHGTEPLGFREAAFDAARESSLYLVTLFLLTPSLIPVALFALGLLIWKVGRSARLGWARLERLHRLIDQERWEITNNREQEREELTEMYRAKGLQGELLEECIDVLMADDNRLLHIMLEEELGLSLETHEHPLKQACGAALGVVTSAFLLGCGWWAFGFIGAVVGGALVMVTSATLSAHFEGNEAIPAAMWHLLIAATAIGAVFVVHI
jgi:hypothetical protein